MSPLSIQVPFPVFQDRDGQPLDNGYIWIGEASLNPQTNPIVAYYDEALTIAAAQPLRTINGYVSRAGSPAKIYIDGVDFSILVQDSKGLMVYGFAEGTGISPDACGVIYNPPFTGAVPTPVCVKLAETISVCDFGAVGDGVTDDVPAINAAIAYANSIGGAAVFFPEGVYRVKTSIQYLSSVDLIGDSMTNCTLLWYPDSNLTGVILNLSNQNLNRSRFENFRFTKHPSITANTTGILGGSTLINYNSAIACFENLHFDFLTYAIRGNSEPTGVGIFDCYFKNIWCSSCFYGLWLFGSSNRIDHPRFTLCNTGIALDYLNSESFDGMVVTGGTFVQNDYDVAVLSASGIRPTTFVNTWHEQANNGIINIPSPLSRVMNLNFIGGIMSVNSTVSMFNAANAIGTISVDRCTLFSGGVGTAQNFIRPVSPGGRLIVRDCQKYDASGVASLVSDYVYFNALKNNVNQSIAPATPTIITWEVATLDLGNNFNNVADAFIVTVPGVYLINSQATFNPHSVSTNLNKLSVYKNAVLVRSALGASNASAQTSVNISCLVECAVGDSIQIWVEHGNGLPIDILGADSLTFFDVQFIGAK